LSDFTLCHRCGTKIERHWRWAVRHALFCLPCETEVSKDPKVADFIAKSKALTKKLDWYHKNDIPVPEIAKDALHYVYGNLRRLVPCGIKSYD
jgi:hypothetical protein